MHMNVYVYVRVCVYIYSAYTHTQYIYKCIYIAYTHKSVSQSLRIPSSSVQNGSKSMDVEKPFKNISSTFCIG